MPKAYCGKNGVQSKESGPMCRCSNSSSSFLSVSTYVGTLPVLDCPWQIGNAFLRHYKATFCSSIVLTAVWIDRSLVRTPPTRSPKVLQSSTCGVHSEKALRWCYQIGIYVIGHDAPERSAERGTRKRAGHGSTHIQHLQVAQLLVGSGVM
jgi:hypothetical protein